MYFFLFLLTSNKQTTCVCVGVNTCPANEVFYHAWLTNVFNNCKCLSLRGHHILKTRHQKNMNNVESLTALKCWLYENVLRPWWSLIMILNVFTIFDMSHEQVKKLRAFLDGVVFYETVKMAQTNCNWLRDRISA